jgi:hypothetical protein
LLLTIVERLLKIVFNKSFFIGSAKNKCNLKQIFRHCKITD